MRRRLNLLCLMSLCSVGLCLCESASAEEYKVDSTHSAVIFRVKHLGVSYCYGRFNTMDGRFDFDAGSLKIELKADSVDTNSPDRDKHLRGPDFFNAKQFPVIKFISNKLKKTGDNKYEVTGDMTLHGVTRPLTATLERVGSGEDPWGGYRTGFETTFTLKRSDFGMDMMTGAIGDQIRVTVSIEGVRQ